MRVPLRRQPYNPMGPLTQEQMLDLKKRLPGPQPHHIFKPWKTGKTYTPNGKREVGRRLRQAA